MMITAMSAMIREITRTTRMRIVLRSALIPSPPGMSGVTAPGAGASSCKAPHSIRAFAQCPPPIPVDTLRSHA